MNFQDCIDFVLKNPKVEIAFHQPAAPQEFRTLPEPGTVPDSGTLLRVTGCSEFLADADTRKRLFDLHPWLKQLGDGTDNPMIAIFRIAEGECSFWTLENNFQSTPAPKITFP